MPVRWLLGFGLGLELGLGLGLEMGFVLNKCIFAWEWSVWTREGGRLVSPGGVFTVCVRGGW